MDRTENEPESGRLRPQWPHRIRGLDNSTRTIANLFVHSRGQRATPMLKSLVGSVVRKTDGKTVFAIFSLSLSVIVEQTPLIIDSPTVLYQEYYMFDKETSPRSKYCTQEPSHIAENPRTPTSPFHTPFQKLQAIFLAGGISR